MTDCCGCENGVCAHNMCLKETLWNSGGCLCMNNLMPWLLITLFHYNQETCFWKVLSLRALGPHLGSNLKSGNFSELCVCLCVMSAHCYSWSSMTMLSLYKHHFRYSNVLDVPRLVSSINAVVYCIHFSSSLITPFC